MRISKSAFLRFGASSPILLPFCGQQRHNKHTIMRAEKYHIEIHNVTSHNGGGGWVVLNLRLSMTGGGWVPKNAKISVT